MVLNAAQAEARRTRVGASEVAALLGAHRYMKPIDVYDRIVHGTQQEANQAMRLGNLLELPVLQAARKLDGLRSRVCHRAYVHPTLPLSCSPDAYAMPHRGYPKGLVEAKVTYAWSDLPEYVYWQAQTQLLLTGRAVCWVAALTGSRLQTWIVEPSAEAFRDIETAVAAFEAECLVPRRPPLSPPPPRYIFGDDDDR